jgi:hypothetical protein
MEGLIEKCIDNVDSMVLRDGNVNIRGIPLFPLVDGIYGSTTLEETLSPDMV